MAKPTKSFFLNKLIDWKEFELFVSDIYKDSDKVKVEHDVTLIGKSGAKRQIDVFVTQISKLHKFTTLIECKRWKKPVTRQVIDVLYASIDDLNASKGVIFTTKGYEKGAIEYAKSKNIDIFIVRDIREDEYGNLGKQFSLYLQMYNGKLSNFDLTDLCWFSTTGKPFKTQPPSLDIYFTKEQKFSEFQQLIDLNFNKGPNFTKLLIDIRSDLLKRRANGSHHFLTPKNEDSEVGFKSRVKLDFTKYKYRFLAHDGGFIEFGIIYFDLLLLISQSKMDFDKTDSLDFALIVENYVSKQRNFVSKPKTESKIKLSEPIIEDEIIDKSKIVNPDDLIKITTEHYVHFQVRKETKILNTNEITINLVTE